MSESKLKEAERMLTLLTFQVPNLPYGVINSSHALDLLHLAASSDAIPDFSDVYNDRPIYDPRNSDNRSMNMHNIGCREMLRLMEMMHIITLKNAK